MSYHVHFLETSFIDKNIVVESAGPDSVVVIDNGTTLLPAIVAEAKAKFWKLKKTHTEYAGFVLKKGPRHGYCACILTYID